MFTGSTATGTLLARSRPRHGSSTTRWSWAARTPRSSSTTRRSACTSAASTSDSAPSTASPSASAPARAGLRLVRAPLRAGRHLRRASCRSLAEALRALRLGSEPRLGRRHRQPRLGRPARQGRRARRRRRRQGRPACWPAARPPRPRPVLLRADPARRRHRRHAALPRRDVRSGLLGLPLRRRRRGDRRRSTTPITASTPASGRATSAGANSSPHASRPAPWASTTPIRPPGPRRAPWAASRSRALGRRHGRHGSCSFTEAQTVAVERLVAIDRLPLLDHRRYAQVLRRHDAGCSSTYPVSSEEGRR